MGTQKTDIVEVNGPDGEIVYVPNTEWDSWPGDHVDKVGQALQKYSAAYRKRA